MDAAYLVEKALVNAVKCQQDFDQFASAIDAIARDYISDKSQREDFFNDLASAIREHEPS